MYLTGPGERDMILMQHDVGVQWFDGSKEKREVSLVVYGDTSVNGYSAMAKTVGLPTGIATKMVLTGVYLKLMYCISAYVCDMEMFTFLHISCLHEFVCPQNNLKHTNNMCLKSVSWEVILRQKQKKSDSQAFSLAKITTYTVLSTVKNTELDGEMAFFS